MDTLEQLPGPADVDADLGNWDLDTTIIAAPRIGMRVVVDLSPDATELVERAAERLGVTFVEFVRRAVLGEAQRLIAENDPTHLLTIAAAAERFGVKRDRLQRAAMEGRLRAHKAGEAKSHPWLVDPADVERFLRESRRGARRKRSFAAAS